MPGDGAKLARGPRENYLFNTTFAGVEAADAILLIGTNPRWEAPVLNARIRKTWLGGNRRIANVGQPYDLTYPVEQLGASPSVLEEIADGTHAFAQVLTRRQASDADLGRRARSRVPTARRSSISRSASPRATGMIGPAGTTAEGGWNGFNVLHTAASRVGALDLGFLPGPDGRDVERDSRRRLERRHRIRVPARRR